MTYQHQSTTSKDLLFHSLAVAKEKVLASTSNNSVNYAEPITFDHLSRSEMLSHLAARGLAQYVDITIYQYQFLNNPRRGDNKYVVDTGSLFFDRCVNILWVEHHWVLLIRDRSTNTIWFQDSLARPFQYYL